MGIHQSLEIWMAAIRVHLVLLKLMHQKDFHFTVAIVNSGPECGNNTANLDNTKTRLRAFRLLT